MAHSNGRSAIYLLLNMMLIRVEKAYRRRNAFCSLFGKGKEVKEMAKNYNYVILVYDIGEKRVGKVFKYVKSTSFISRNPYFVTPLI